MEMNGRRRREGEGEAATMLFQRRSNVVLFERERVRTIFFQ